MPSLEKRQVNTRTLHTKITIGRAYHISILAQRDYATTLGAPGWFIFWRILQFFEIVLICPKIYIHLCLKALSAFRTVFPVPRVTLVVVIAAKRVAIMIPMTAVSGVRKKDVFVFIVANPVITALGLCKLFGFAA
jgi:hypothetical protein